MPFFIREASPPDAEALYALYTQHLSKNPSPEPLLPAVYREKLARFAADPSYHLLVGETDGQVVSSVTLVVIENLTHDMHPYALIENVVTHADFRGRHFASALMERACELAREAGCYKVMLLTGSKLDATLRFYENCGFNRRDKTAFIRWLDRPQG